MPQFFHLNQLSQTLPFPTSSAPAQVEIGATHGGTTFISRTLSSIHSRTCPYNPYNRAGFTHQHWQLIPCVGNYLQAARFLAMERDKAKCPKAQAQMSTLLCPAACTGLPADLWVMLIVPGDQQLQKPQCSLSKPSWPTIVTKLVTLEMTPSHAYLGGEWLSSLAMHPRAPIHSKGCVALPQYKLHNTHQAVIRLCSPKSLNTFKEPLLLLSVRVARQARHMLDVLKPVPINEAICYILQDGLCWKRP